MIVIRHEEKKYTQLILESLPKIKKHLEEIANGVVVEGYYQIDDIISVNYFSYQSTEAINRQWETHQDHIDLHFILAGEEKVQLAEMDSLKIVSYDEKNDSFLQEGESMNTIDCKTNDCLILYPLEPHKTGVMLEKPIKVNKAVYKLKTN